MLDAEEARWWVDAVRQPYTGGWVRKAFRAPGNPEVTRRSRMLSLRQLLERVGPYDRDVVWLAAWAPHLGRELGGPGAGFAHQLAGPLLAAGIDRGGPIGEQVLATLVEIGQGEHPIGMMDRHVIVGLLRAGRPEGLGVRRTAVARGPAPGRPAPGDPRGG